MNLTPAETNWVLLKEGDPSFQLTDRFIIADRAGLEIGTNCPQLYAEMIAKALQNKWVKLVAVVPKTDPTLVWETLKN